jgi:hypothetical protein
MRYKDNTIVGFSQNFSENFFLDIGDKIKWGCVYGKVVRNPLPHNLHLKTYRNTL